MRPAPLITVLLLSTCLLAQTPTNAPNDQVERNEMLRLERVWNEAHLKGDARALDQLWEESLVVTVPGMAPMAKADSMGVWRSGQVKFDRYETSEVKVSLYGDTAVVTGRLLRTRTFGNRSMDDNWRFTKTYIKRDNKWQVVAYHASPVAL